MRVSAKVDYAVRAAVELAAQTHDGPVTASEIADAQGIPLKFLETILAELRHAGLVESVRGPHGGHRLAHPADRVTVADVIRAIDGPLAGIAGLRPEDLEPPGAAGALREVWVAVRASLRRVLEATTLGDVAAGQLPAEVADLVADPDAWVRRPRAIIE